MKKWIAGLLMMIGVSAGAGSLGLPMERISVLRPHSYYETVEHLICIWDASEGAWLQDHEVYDNSGVYDFQIPEWGKWYWIGLWNTENQYYSFGEWVCHFK